MTETPTLTLEGNAGDAVFIDLRKTDFVRTDVPGYALLTSERSRFTLRLNLTLDLGGCSCPHRDRARWRTTVARGFDVGDTDPR